MKNPNIFSIRNLRCSYDGQQEVVHIPQLDIPRGKFVGLLSVSGGGKSTTLETLGLMNMTFLPGSEIKLYPEPDGPGVDYAALWADKTEKEAAAIRRGNFSFIFQQTNLMPNFTAYENICLSQMIQGKSQQDSLDQVKKVLHKIGLDQIQQQQKPWELSGGQQQRVAFARAITPDFSVIFGDEPTGNLDPQNSRALMGMLYEAVKEKQRTAIIVSHNFTLIEAYADMLILLTKPGKVGTLAPENVFFVNRDEQGKRTWTDGKQQTIENLVSTLRSRMQTSNSLEI